MSRRAWLVGLTCAVCLAGAVVTLPRLRLLTHAAQYGRARPLRMPVSGLQPREARSSWHAPRSGGRRHEGIDLFAKKGTPVVSATRGEVWRIGTDRLGGNVVTVLGDGPALYYYAHLDDWDDGLYVGRRVEKGTVLGLVGNTGNARTTPPHLHFGVYRVGWWRSGAVDPAPLLGVR
ncbi:MAG: M23 family metallopeptidase [Archangium sp.]|nr:M23 family metallopeptidase [Archangium sp.]